MKSDKKIIIMNEGIEYDVKDKYDCVSVIFEEYERFSVSMSEVLASIEIRGFSAEDVVDIYAECVKKSDSDTMVRFFDEVDNEDLSRVSNDNHLILGL